MLHVLRIQAAVLHELLRLMRVNSQQLKDPVFGQILQTLPPAARKRWHAMVAVATDKPSNHPFAKALEFIRNKVASHYDAALIGQAFARLAPAEPPALFMSRGATLGASRFHFADAAVDSFVLQMNQTKEAKKILLDPTEFLEGIQATLFCVVTQFVDARGLDARAPNNSLQRTRQKAARR